MPARPDPPAADPGAAFARLFARHHQDVFGYIYALVPNWADAGDILQDTSVKLWEGFDRFRPGTSFVAWACAVARYEVLAHRRRRKPVFDPELLDMLAADAQDVAEDADDRRDALRDCLRKLPPARRRLVELVYADGGSAAGAARELGRPVESVYAGLSQARRQLRECVNAQLGADSGEAGAVVAGASALSAGGGVGDLAGVLRGSAAARRAYAELMHDAVGLRQWAGVQRPQLKIAPGTARSAARTLPRWPWLAGGAAAAAAVLAVMLAPPAAVEQVRRPDPQPPVAALVAASDAVWADGRGPAAGDRLAAGRTLDLTSGTITLKLDGGAEVVVQGPATLVAESAGTVSLRAGAVTVTGGATVRTPAGEFAADAGALFGARAGPATAEAHVLNGAVTVRAAGQARRVDALSAAGVSAAGVLDARFDVSQFPAAGALDPARPVVREFWLNLGGNAPGLTRLLRHPAFVAGRPDGRDTFPAFEVPPQKRPWEQFGARLTARLKPPVTGAYTFRVAADDFARLTLVDDSDTARTLATVSGHTLFRERARFPSQQSKPVPLEAGRAYRLEVLYDQRTQAAHLSVGWTLPDGSREDPIPGNRLVRPGSR